MWQSSEMERLVSFIKADCETCQLTAPLLADLLAAGVIHQIVTQDDDFPAAKNDAIVFDESLERSFKSDIGTECSSSTKSRTDRTKRCSRSPTKPSTNSSRC